MLRVAVGPRYSLHSSGRGRGIWFVYCNYSVALTTIILYLIRGFSPSDWHLIWSFGNLNTIVERSCRLTTQQQGEGHGTASWGESKLLSSGARGTWKLGNIVNNSKYMPCALCRPSKLRHCHSYSNQRAIYTGRHSSSGTWHRGVSKISCGLTLLLPVN